VTDSHFVQSHKTESGTFTELLACGCHYIFVKVAVSSITLVAMLLLRSAVFHFLCNPRKDKSHEDTKIQEKSQLGTELKKL
jgi:hypothetical protein